MGVWLDLIGSFLVGSLLALNALQMGTALRVQADHNLQDFVAQSRAVSVAEAFEADVRQAGYGVSGTALLVADSLQVRFLTDLEADGAVDTLHYYAGSVSTASHTPNPNDRAIYRQRNSQTPAVFRSGITGFRLCYFNAQGDSLAFPVSPEAVRQIRLDVHVESPAPYELRYATAFARVSVWPRNL